jgi:hypothetical protein
MAWLGKKSEEKKVELKVTHCPYKGCGMSSTSVAHVQAHMKLSHGEK